MTSSPGIISYQVQDARHTTRPCFSMVFTRRGTLSSTAGERRAAPTEAQVGFPGPAHFIHPQVLPITPSSSRKFCRAIPFEETQTKPPVPPSLHPSTHPSPTWPATFIPAGIFSQTYCSPNNALSFHPVSEGSSMLNSQHDADSSSSPALPCFWESSHLPDDNAWSLLLLAWPSSSRTPHTTSCHW